MLSDFIVTVFFCEQVWALDRGCFQTIMMNTGIIRQSEYLKFLKRYMDDGVSIDGVGVTSVDHHNVICHY